MKVEFRRSIFGQHFLRDTPSRVAETLRHVAEVVEQGEEVISYTLQRLSSEAEELAAQVVIHDVSAEVRVFAYVRDQEVVCEHQWAWEVGEDDEQVGQLCQECGAWRSAEAAQEDVTEHEHTWTVKCRIDGKDLVYEKVCTICGVLTVSLKGADDHEHEWAEYQQQRCTICKQWREE